jgi:hypothetical protein
MTEPIGVEDLDALDPVDPPARLADVAAGPAPDLSPAEALRAAHEKAKITRRGTKKAMLVGYGEPATELWVTFRYLTDYKEVRNELRKALNKRGMDGADQELAIAVETLLMAAEGSYAIINHQQVDIGEPLGLGLYEYLGLDKDAPARASTDREALYRLFTAKEDEGPNTLLITTIAAEFDAWVRRGGPEDDEVLGESSAA